jgi:acyl dehydratase
MGGQTAPLFTRREKQVRVFKSLAELVCLEGQELAVSPWHLITQSQIDGFAQATLDQQWIHVDPARARLGPYGQPIAHGFLTLSLMPWLMDQALSIQEETTSINYGLNKVRFTSVVVVDSHIRARFVLAQVKPLARPDASMQPNPQAEGYELTWDVVFELLGQDKPACVAQCVVRRFRGSMS